MSPSTSFVVALGIVLCASTPRARARADGAVAFSPRSKTVEVRDDVLGVVAFRMQIPDNWTFEGAVLRDPRCDMLPAVAYRLSSPDGLAGVQVLPEFGWHWSDDPQNLKIYRAAHCKVMEPMSAADFLSYVAASIRPDPVVGSIGPTADAAQLDAMIAQYNGRAQRTHVPTSESGGGARAILKYTLHGHAIEENLRVTVNTFDNQLASGRGPAHHAWASIADVTGARAPVGQLDSVLKQLAPVMQSGGYTPEWQQRVSKKISDDTNRALADIKRRGDEIRITLARNHDLYMKQSQRDFSHAQAAEREREDAVHRSAVAWTLYAGDEQLVRNPQTGAVSRVTNQAGTHGYQDQGGDILMSKDPNFDPNFYVRGTWTQLEAVDPLQP